MQCNPSLPRSISLPKNRRRTQEKSSAEKEVYDFNADFPSVNYPSTCQLLRSHIVDAAARAPPCFIGRAANNGVCSALLVTGRGSLPFLLLSLFVSLSLSRRRKRERESAPKTNERSRRSGLAMHACQPASSDIVKSSKTLIHFPPFLVVTGTGSRGEGRLYFPTTVPTSSLPH